MSKCITWQKHWADRGIIYKRIRKMRRDVKMFSPLFVIQTVCSFLLLLQMGPIVEAAIKLRQIRVPIHPLVFSFSSPSSWSSPLPSSSPGWWVSLSWMWLQPGRREPLLHQVVQRPTGVLQVNFDDFDVNNIYDSDDDDFDHNDHQMVERPTGVL